MAAAGVVLVGAVAVLATRQPGAGAQHIALAPPSPVVTPSTAPSDQPTPFVAAPTDTPTPTPTPIPKSTPSPSPSSGSVSIVDPTIQAARGGRATLLALTTPRARCTITVGYSPAPRLSAATANGAGAVGWSWKVADQVKPGTYPIQVTCGEATAGATITVS
ncbi:MAG: hypothetical protein E6J41_14655 [Chloroflexi bacterium]|nr:MAG: hypothetical protein E6J41_14655 [Chloroflexota bacterium]